MAENLICEYGATGRRIRFGQRYFSGVFFITLKEKTKSLRDIYFIAPDKGKNEEKFRLNDTERIIKYENNFCGSGYFRRKNNYC